MKFTLMILFGALLYSGTTMDDSIADSWKRIESARKAKVRKPDKLNPPASKEDIDKLEKHLGCEIPKQLRASLLLHNGMEQRGGLEIVDDNDGTSQAYRWLGVAGIRKQWDEDRQRQKEAEAEGRHFQVDPKWIPIFVDAAEGEEIIYLDSSDGTVMLRITCASEQIQEHHYKDLNSFLGVFEHFIRNQWWFEWGRDANWKPTKQSFWTRPSLNEEGIALLINSQKDEVVLKLADGKSIGIKEFETKEKGNEFANAVLESFMPVQTVRTPGVQNPDQELSFSVNGTEFLIAIKRVDGVKLPARDGKLIYSIGRMQYCGGDAAKLEELISKLAE